jgi:hypothetical protein
MWAQRGLAIPRKVVANPKASMPTLQEKEKNDEV